MNRSLKLSMLMALALGSSHVLALDLGQVQVKSTLGQPLLAEIPLHPADAAELKNLTVQLASGEEFARAGIVGGRPSIPLHFSVVNGASGTKLIRITSTVTVDNPYLDLLIELNGSAGKSVREFAILLDPPGSSTTPTAAVAATAPKSKATRAKVAAAPAAKPATTMPKPAAKAAAVASNGEYGPVAAGQTLSGIARSTAPAGVDLQQMMLALKQANPDAFYRDNINALKSGAVLRVPSAAEAQSMTLAAAIAEVSRQNSDWRAGTPGKPAVVADAATRSNAFSGPTGKAGVVEDRLALVPAKAGGVGSQGNNAGGKGDKSVASLRQDLLRAQETTASLQQQSNDLKSRLKDLSDINGKNERLLSLKDNEIAELQSKLAEARRTAGLPAAATTVAKAMEPAVAPQPEAAAAKAASVASVASSSAALATKGPAAAGTASTPAAASTAAAVVPVAMKAAKQAPRPAAKPVIKPSPMPVVEEPWYMQTWAWAAGGAALLLLIVLGLRGRRGKPSAKTSGAKGTSSLADRFSAAPLPGGDDLGEEDVDQDELLDQLAEHPDDIDLHLELVTLYYSRRDVERFEAAAEAMHAHITDTEQDEWQDVLHMGEDLVPAHPLFDHHPEAAVHEDAEVHRAFDIDDYENEHEAPTVASSMPPSPSSGPKKVSEYSFNFDLTQPAPGDSAPGHHSTAADDATVVAPRDTTGHAEPTLDEDMSWQAASGGNQSSAEGQSFDITEFSDDPVDTKLDLARAYVDMGDADGARAMLGEVIKEGTQTQQDVARRLLDTLS